MSLSTAGESRFLIKSLPGGISNFPVPGMGLMIRILGRVLTERGE